MKVEKIKELIQSCNVNFLIGSGLSRPYLNTLGDIENWLTELSKEDNSSQKEIVRASVYAKYFTDVIKPNLQSEIDDDIIGDYDDVLGFYCQFLILWNDIIVRRASRLHNKQINIFSTNIDLFVERAAEKVGIEFNDGFKGRINPVFDEGNFQKSYTKTSTHYQNVSEIPVFNLLKLHGSIDWKTINTDTKQISHDSLLGNVQEVDKALESISQDTLIKIEPKDTLAKMVTKVNALSKIDKEAIKPFTHSYDKLVVINPTKQKFKDTVLDLHFYELMRIYSNVLEKENSLLFVMGFSFADEHIAKITMRVADSNPTLLIIIFSFSDSEKTKFEEYLKLNSGKSKNNNILIITPSEFIETNAEGDKDKLAKLKRNVTNFDFKTLNTEVFEQISRMIPINSGNGK